MRKELEQLARMAKKELLEQYEKSCPISTPMAEAIIDEFTEKVMERIEVRYINPRQQRG